MLLGAHALLPGQIGRYGAYLLCAAATALAVRRGIARHRPAHRSGWQLVQVGLWFHTGYGLVGLGAAVLPGSWWWGPAELVVDTAGHLAIAAAAVVFLAHRRPGADRDG